ncbi:MAG: SRPBCC family protein, partial [Myxococcota bacterium]
MSSLKIEETFEVNAPPDRVWAFLKDPSQVVTCLPGAALDEVVDDQNYLGNVKVKVGPVTVAYKGKATLTEVDEDNRRVLIHGAGKEKAGGGNVSMDMVGRVEPTEAGSRVSFDADVKLAGKIVRFGRGMIQGVSDQLFKQFVDKARSVLEAPAPEAPAEVETPASSETEATSGVVSTDGAKPSAPAEEDRASLPAPTSDEKALARPRRGITVVKQEQEAVDGLSLLFKVLWAGITSFFRRLFGGGTKS